MGKNIKLKVEWGKENVKGNEEIYAFPCLIFTKDKDRNVWRQYHSGMELRDYFAAAAMEGLLASQGTSGGEWTTDDKTVAKAAYTQADAMMKQRKK